MDQMNLISDDLLNSPLLSHHGIKGMKWGVWNEETRARRTGSKQEYRTQMKESREIAKQIREQTKQAKREARINEPVNKAKREAIKFDRKQARKNRSLLSDKELMDRSLKLQREKQLRELTDQEVYLGKRYVDKFVNTGVEIGQSKMKQAAGVQKKNKKKK